MKLEFSPALQLAFDRASYLAGKEIAAEITPRHLLRGLLAEEEGTPATRLIAAGADWSRLFEHYALTRFTETMAARDLPQQGSLRVVMMQAAEIAAHHGDEGTIATEHVLLALLRVMDTMRGELEGFGLDFARFQHGIVGDPGPLILDEPLDLRDPVEEGDTARILDASANRAREAMRVLEDYARFVLGDAFLCERFKQMRHAFAEAVQMLSVTLLLDSRDTPGDVGTAISTRAEWQRAAVADVVQANCKRLQEALRSLEEYGKILHDEFAQRIERIRYQSYTLERTLVRGGTSRELLAGAQLYVLVTDSLCRASLVGTVKEALLGGAQIIQLREKNVDDRTLLAGARDLRQLTREAGALFIMNDRPDLARLAEADGVHLGQDDMPIRDARRILGPEAIIGVSTHTIEQVRQAILDGANYIGVGPTFPSETKAFDALAGLDFVRQAFAETSLPAFAIGGVHLDNVDQVVAAGARGIAVSHAVGAADDPRGVASRFRLALRNSPLSTPRERGRG